MNTLKDILHSKDCSLVVRSRDGVVMTYNKKGVRDLVWLLDNEPERLQDAKVADKVDRKSVV